MLKNILYITIFSLISQLAYADEAADKAKFKELYAQFKDLYANSEAIDPIIVVAEKLYKLVPKVYGKNSKTHGVITYNLASLYDEKGGKTSSKDEKKAVQLYERYFTILDRNKTVKDKEYLNHLIALIYADNNARIEKAKLGHIKNAIKIAEKLKLPINTIANYELNFALLKYNSNKVLQAEYLFKSSLERYQNTYGEDHFKVGENLFWLAKISMAKRKHKTSEDQFLKALNIFENNDGDSSALAQSTHAFLVNLYEDMGQSDKATKHCKAIAQERPKDFDQYIDPLYRKPPLFPQNLRTKELSNLEKKDVNVILKFDVDQDGFTKNVAILESDNKKFNLTSINAVKKFRFAPSVKDGKLVATLGVRNRMVFRLAK